MLIFLGVLAAGAALVFGVPAYTISSYFKHRPLPPDWSIEKIQRSLGRWTLGLTLLAVTMLIPLVLLLFRANVFGWRWPFSFLNILAFHYFLALLSILAIAKVRQRIRVLGQLSPSASSSPSPAVIVAAVSTVLAWALGIGTVAFGGFFTAMAGMGWGRPLRINGKTVRPKLKRGDDWAQGERANAASLDADTKKALEALWLHDAKKEHASVPAFSRLGWQLAGIGAPPELLRDVHLAAIQEITHARKCFAMAASFGEAALSPEPIPEVFDDRCGYKDRPVIGIAVDSLIDGCLLEGFNADTAAESALPCKDRASLRLIKQIASEESSHAELAWRIVAFCLTQEPRPAAEALSKAASGIDALDRPTAASSQVRPLVAKADAQALRDFGRLPDEEFDALWRRRVDATQRRLVDLLKPLPSTRTTPALLSR
ncbi:MAG: hypothetical protein HY078_16040 [Elusimicrobia bacterium]|nr:hypothetical protein [Elusimicrobiota bacterium]